MTFAEELKQWRGQWRGGGLQKNACDFFGVSIDVYKAWELGRTEPSELAKKQIRMMIQAQHAGVPVEVYIHYYWRVIKQVAAEIELRK